MKNSDVLIVGWDSGKNDVGAITICRPPDDLGVIEVIRTLTGKKAAKLYKTLINGSTLPALPQKSTFFDRDGNLIE